MAIEIKSSGPLFSGVAGHVLSQAVEQCQRKAADTVEEVWQAHMDTSFQHPTGFYQSHVNIASRGRDLVVNDAGVIYGPWLEGTGSRNFPVTRFKGYASARRTEQYVDRMVPEICRPIIDRAVAEMNHG